MNRGTVSQAILVCNAPMELLTERLLTEAARHPSTLIVGVDGGAMRLMRLGIPPHVVTGDFDSLTKQDIAHFKSLGASVVPTPDQDYTDLDKALTYVTGECGATPVAIYGAVGGRLDHTQSVLSAVLKHGVYGGNDIRLVDSVGETRPVRGGELVLRGDDLPGRVLSLMAFGIVRGVTLTGVRWTLAGEDLAPGVRDGTLNEITETTVTVRCATNAPLLVQVHHQPLPEHKSAEITPGADAHA